MNDRLAVFDFGEVNFVVFCADNIDFVEIGFVIACDNGVAVTY